MKKSTPRNMGFKLLKMMMPTKDMVGIDFESPAFQDLVKEELSGLNETEREDVISQAMILSKEIGNVGFGMFMQLENEQ